MGLNGLFNQLDEFIKLCDKFHRFNQFGYHGTKIFNSLNEIFENKVS
jgi:hypothetical protein